jgi:hypothetical protein
MSKHIKIPLIKSLIINTVKNVTFKRGQVDKAADVRNTVVAYHETAGDEQYHERLLERGYYTNVELLKTRLSDYLDGTGNIAEDPLISGEETGGTNTIVLKVSDRFNDGYVKSLARLCSRFVEDCMIADWYSSFDDKRSAYFAQLAERDLASVRLSFAKTSPKAPAYQFPTAINLRYPVIPERDGIPGYVTPDNRGLIDPVQLYGNPWIISRGDESEISYTISGEDGAMPLDDIIVRCDDPCCEACVASDGGWLLKACSPGFTIVTLFSRHDDTVFAKFAVRIV